MAEGLYRKAAALLRLRTKAEAVTAAQETDAGYASVRCLVAWRLAQLYGVTDKRETESRQWADTARERCVRLAACARRFGLALRPRDFERRRHVLERA